jgi:putative ABC transport system substrate-binding protein
VREELNYDTAVMYDASGGTVRGLLAIIICCLIIFEAAAFDTSTVVYLVPVGQETAAGFAEFEREFARQVPPNHPGARLERRAVPIAPPEHLSASVRQLRDKPPTVVVTAHTGIAQAVVAEMPNVSLLIVTLVDPVFFGLSDDALNPRMNVSGYTYYAPFELKHFELLLEARPSIRRVGVLVDDYWPSEAIARRILDEGPRLFGIVATHFPVNAVEEISAVVRSEEGMRMDAWFVPDTPFNRVHAAHITREFSMARKLSIGAHSSHTRYGGTMSYEPENEPPWPKVAGMVKSVLSGVAAREIPMDRPKRFRLVINQKAATELGVKLPRSLLMRADELVR